ncbi:MAG: putative transposase [Rhodospirillales bacterium]|nr:putative transposase [Rhodospirillales bacterium]
MATFDRLTDAEWELIALFFPAPQDRKQFGPVIDNRVVVDALLWLTATGTRWRRLPASRGNGDAIRRRVRRWVEDGVFDRLAARLDALALGAATADLLRRTLAREDLHADDDAVRADEPLSAPMSVERPQTSAPPSADRGGDVLPTSAPTSAATSLSAASSADPAAQRPHPTSARPRPTSADVGGDAAWVELSTGAKGKSISLKGGGALTNATTWLKNLPPTMLPYFSGLAMVPLMIWLWSWSLTEVGPKLDFLADRLGISRAIPAAVFTVAVLAGTVWVLLLTHRMTRVRVCPHCGEPVRGL